MTLPELRTGRLWLRPLRHDDAGDLHAVFGDAECMRFWHRPPCATPRDSRAAVADMLRDDAGQWAFGRRGSPETLGHVGFVVGLESDGHAGFGYALRRSEWGRGYTPEAAAAALEHGFAGVGVARAELWIHPDNRRSIRVAEKLGCQRRGEVHVGYPRGPTRSLVYGVTAAGWRGLPEPPPAHYGVEPVLAVSDVAAAVEWWRSALGCRVGFVHGSPPTHASVRLQPGWTGTGGVQLTRRPAAEAGGGAVYVNVSAVDELAARARRAGATVVGALGDRPWGMREVELADPDGNLVRVGAPAA